MISNGLAPNPYKTQALRIFLSKINFKSISWAINNIPIDSITLTAKYLGIAIHSTLSFTNQINKI